MATTYLSRTNTTPTSAYKWTWSGWLKRSELATRGQFFRVINPSDTAYYAYIEFQADDKLHILDYSVNGQLDLVTTAVFRDISAWYHVVVNVDTTQATSTDRVKMYVNGQLVTALDSQSITSGQNSAVTATESGKDANIGGDPVGAGATRKFGGLMAHVHFIDGTAYDASAFGETDATTGIWKPKTAPSVTYGTNGFFLKFANSGSMGTDSSGNGNNFTINGNLTQTIDTPSNVFCTMNPLYKWDYNLALSNGNTTVSGTQNQWQGACGTLGITKGKYYFEYKFNSATDINNYYVGFMSLDDYKTSEPFRNGIHYYNYDGGEVYWSNTSTYGNTTSDYGTGTNGDIFGLALDYDNSLISVYKNGTALVTDYDFSASISTAKGGNIVTPVIGHYGSGSVQFNFGNGYFGTTAVSSAQSPSDGIGIFEYAVPSGYKALCTKSINAQEYS